MSSNDKQVYVIQLFAMKNPTKETVFRGLQNVKSIVGDDGYTRYIYGEYIGKVSAKQALQDVINKGFYDAFVVEKSKFQKGSN